MHSVVFKNTENDSEKALALGNGVLGTMAYFQNSSRFIPINHYETYYNIGENVLPSDMLASLKEVKGKGGLRRRTLERAERNQPLDGESFTYFRLDKAVAPSYGVPGFSGSYLMLNLYNQF